MQKLVLSCFSFLGALAFWTAGAHAGVMLSPVSVSVSSAGVFDPVNTINQSGLSANYVSGVTDFDTFVNSTTASYSPSISGSLGDAGAPASYFQFDFDSIVEVDALAIWNQFGSASLATFSIETSLAADFAISQTSGIFSIGQDGPPTDAAVFEFASSPFQFLRVNNISNGGFTATRVNEFTFRSADVNPVPEPSSLAIFGICSIGLAVARRRVNRT